MDIRARRRKVNIGFAFLSEVAADVLQEADGNGEPWLNDKQIYERSGFIPNIVAGGHYSYAACRHVIARMEAEGGITIPGPGTTWRLTGETSDTAPIIEG